MIARGDRDPTDLGLLSEADVIELHARRERPAAGGNHSRPDREPSRTIGPVTPPASGGSERVREHMDGIYEQMGWTRQELAPDEEQARQERWRRRELQRRG